MEWVLILTLLCCSGRPPAFSQQQLQQRQCGPFRPTAAALLRPATTALPAAAASTGLPIVSTHACIAYDANSLFLRMFA